MNYLRCKCGKCQMWESGMNPQPCEGCTECNTTFAWGPDYHDELQPHEWKQQYDQNTGKPNGAVCTRCYKRDKSVTIEVDKE